MIGSTNAGGGGGSGATLTITAPAGCTVTVSKDGKVKTRVANADGIAEFKGLKTGEWTVAITDGEQTAQKIVTITVDYAMSIVFNVIPAFTYTGDYKIVNENWEEITASSGTYMIELLTSGTLIFTESDVEIDVFCVGGGGGGGGHSSSGGGGGGGGYTKTGRKIQASKGTQYTITIGSGGNGGSKDYSGLRGGTTSAFGLSVSGGYGGGSSNGGKGGNGGSGGGSFRGNGGSDGKSAGGTGQGTTTRFCGESNSKLFAGGGAGGYNIYSEGAKIALGGDGGGGNSGCEGDVNTGGGGGGGIYDSHMSGSNGGSGIVIIRNARG